MSFFKILPVYICFLFFAVVACDYEPWINNETVSETDKVIVTKITAYGVQKDGISPYKGNIGSVTMPHKAHARQGLLCADCHHIKGNEDKINQCAVCHNGDEGFDTMHGLCVDCHIEKRKGPQRCMECH